MTYHHVSLVFILCLTIVFLLLALGSSQVGETLWTNMRQGPPRKRFLAALAWLVPAILVFLVALAALSRSTFPHWLMH